MRRLIVLLVGLCLVASGSSQVVGARGSSAAAAAPGSSVGCVTAAESFTGRPYCLDGNHAAAYIGITDTEMRLAGVAALAGWKVPTRCDGNGTSGKRVQLVYVHVAGTKSKIAADLPFITQQLIPGANGVFEHSSVGKRAIRWVTKKQVGGCVPAIMQATVPKSLNNKGFPFENIGRALRTANPQLRRTDRNYLLLVDTPDHPFGEPFNDCGLGSVQYDPRPGPNNVNNSGQGFAMVWSNCWTGLVTAHELTHTLGAVQPTAPHKTDNGHCWDGYDDMCYNDGSKQKQRVICKGADAYRELDCNGDDYFSLSPRKGSYLATHWNSANSQFLIQSKARPLPTQPGRPTITTSVTDPTHLLVSWTPGATKRGAITSWTVSLSPTDETSTVSGTHGPPVNLLAKLTKVDGKARSALVPVTSNALYEVAVFGTNVSGDGVLSAPVTTGAGAPPTPIVATFTSYPPGGSVYWTGGQSDPTLFTCTAVLVNGVRIDFNGPGQTLDNTTDPQGNCDSDSPGTSLPAMAPTDVLEIYARNLFGVTRVTVPHS